MVKCNLQSKYKAFISKNILKIQSIAQASTDNKLLQYYLQRKQLIISFLGWLYPYSGLYGVSLNVPKFGTRLRTISTKASVSLVTSFKLSQINSYMGLPAL